MEIPKPGRNSELSMLAHKYGTDKGPKVHNYTVVYERAFRKFKWQTFNLLEIGVKNGASLRMWADYFPKATINGIDKTKKCAELEGRFNVFIGDQGSSDDLLKVATAAGPFTIIIDDGGHMCSDQATSFFYLWPHLKNNGCYVVEDLHTANMPKYCDIGPVTDIFQKVCIPVVRDANQLGAVTRVGNLLFIWKSNG